MASERTAAEFKRVWEDLPIEARGLEICLVYDMLKALAARESEIAALREELKAADGFWEERGTIWPNGKPSLRARIQAEYDMGQEIANSRHALLDKVEKLRARAVAFDALVRAAEELLKSKMSAVPSGVFVGVEEYHALRAALVAVAAAGEGKPT